jgi:putative endonuclease
MNRRQSLGRRGEDLACTLLAEQGYEIVERNWRCARGEIDIVAREGACWAFVEVKARRGHRTEYPEDGLTAAKLTRLVELAQLYLGEHALDAVSWRIDLAAVEWDDGRGLARFNLVRGVGAY